MRPKAFTPASIIRLTSSSVAASHVTALARPPAFVTRSAVSRTRSVDRAAQITAAFSCANRRLSARPMPFDAPVIIATLPSSSAMAISSGTMCRGVYRITCSVIAARPPSRDDTTSIGHRREDNMNDRTHFLRRSLQLDGIASGLTGVLLLLGAGPISALIGLSEPTLARVIGALLAVYAAALLWNAARARVSRGETVAAVVLNAAWVLGSIAVIELGPLTMLGNVAVAAVALAVLAFAILEILGLRRLREAEAS